MDLFPIEEHGAIRVLKRGQSTEEFNLDKIKAAILAAFDDVGATIEPSHLEMLSKVVKAKIILRFSPEEEVPVETIQDFVEVSLMEIGYTTVAKSYILYREKRALLREGRHQADPRAIMDYIHPSKYARYLEDAKRRESYSETVSRVEGMHLNKYAGLLDDDIKEAFDFVREKKVLPSMRAMQFAGSAIEDKNARQYNCCFMLVDKVRAFSDALYLLLCGCGVGYSIQFDHIEKLPALGYVDENNVRHYAIADTIEGWAEALKQLINSYVRGYYVEFSYAKIRDKGSPLKTSGGKAPGHLGLKSSLERVRAILDQAQGRQLRPIECYDIMCHAADAVLSGGVRRSATIALFSPGDGEMMAAKTGKWFDTHPWRANSNNSVVLNRSEVKKKEFKRVFKSIKEFGEPGFVFTDDINLGFNPCAEINLDPILTITEDVMEIIDRKRAEGVFIPKLKLGDTFTGTAFCNLTEMNAAAFKSPEDMIKAAVMAARLGTLQAGYTNFPYLGWVSEVIAEREALLGVSMTGMMEQPEFSLDPELQRKAAEAAVAENKRVAEIIGIRQAARVTTVKPAGTSSLELGGVSSGIHAHHARRYFRRVTAKENEPVFQYFKSINPHMCFKKPDGNWVIVFPVQVGEQARVKADMSAVEFLSTVRSTQNNWVRTGIARPDSSPKACHNVSNTVNVKEDEWGDVADYVWAHKKDFSGISFLPSTGDKDYAFSPMEAVSTQADEELWNNLIRHYTPVDYKAMVEDEDSTDLTGEIACAGGACEI